MAPRAAPSAELPGKRGKMVWLREELSTEDLPPSLGGSHTLHLSFVHSTGRKRLLPEAPREPGSLIVMG